MKKNNNIMKNIGITNVPSDYKNTLFEINPKHNMPNNIINDHVNAYLNLKKNNDNVCKIYMDAFFSNFFTIENVANIEMNSIYKFLIWFGVALLTNIKNNYVENCIFTNINHKKFLEKQSYILKGGLIYFLNNCS